MTTDSPGRWKFSVAAALLALSVLAAIVWWQRAPAPDSAIVTVPTAAALPQAPEVHRAESGTAAPTVAIASTPATASPSVPIPHSRLALNRVLSANTDLMPLLASALPEARRGDANAQYVAGAILQFCGDDPPSSTLEDKQQQSLRILHSASAGKAMQDTAKRSLQSCGAICRASRDDIGYGNDWLLHAAASGQPLAMLDQATSVDPSVLQDRREEFLHKAIDSGNPEVMQALATAALETVGDDTGHSMQAITAALVACEFGADCSRTSEQLQALATDPDDGRRYVSVQDFAGQQLNSDEYAKAANFVADFSDRARKQALGAKLQQDEAGTFRLSVEPAPPSTR